MIAEDEALERQVIQKNMEKNFSHIADIRTAADGIEAMSIAQIWNADIIIMDIEMPGMNGIDAANKIAKYNPRVKIIFLTAYEKFEYAREAIRLKAVDYLLKPVDDGELFDVVHRTIGELQGEKKLYEKVKEIKIDNKEGLTQTGNQLLMEKVVEYVHHNYRYDISQEAICDILKLSTGYFSKIFHQHYGVKFIDYLTNVRIEAAKDLLKDDTKRNKEIGLMVGYQSSSYFSKMFKLKTGFTPSEYRELLHESKDISFMKAKY